MQHREPCQSGAQENKSGRFRICDDCPLPSVRQIVQCGEALRQARAEAQAAGSRMETIKSRSRADRIAIVEAFQFGCLNVTAEKSSDRGKSDTDIEVTRRMKSRIGNEVSGPTDEAGGASHERAIGKNLEVKAVKCRRKTFGCRYRCS